MWKTKVDEFAATHIRSVRFVDGDKLGSPGLRAILISDRSVWGAYGVGYDSV